MPIGLPELLILAGVLLLVFGASRVPEIGRALGGGLREFKRGVLGIEEREREP